MNQNKFIVGSKGFFKEILRDPETHLTTIIWVDNISNSTAYTSKQATNIISKYELDAFVWSPYKNKETDKRWRK